MSKWIVFTKRIAIQGVVWAGRIFPRRASARGKVSRSIENTNSSSHHYSIRTCPMHHRTTDNNKMQAFDII